MIPLSQVDRHAVHAGDGEPRWLDVGYIPGPWVIKVKDVLDRGNLLSVKPDGMTCRSIYDIKSKDIVLSYKLWIKLVQKSGKWGKPMKNYTYLAPHQVQ